MGRLRLFAAVAGAAVVLLAGGSAAAGSAADKALPKGACLTDAASLVAFVAPAKGKLGKALAPVVSQESLKPLNALGTAITCADQAEKALVAPPAVKVPGKARLTPHGRTHCSEP